MYMKKRWNMNKEAYFKNESKYLFIYSSIHGFEYYI